MLAKIMIIISLTAPIVIGTRQQLTFYEEPDCTGEIGTITDTRDDIFNFRMGNASSLKILGLWKLTTFKKIEHGLSKFTIIPTKTKGPNGRCINKKEWDIFDPGNYTIYYAERFGPDDMSSSQVVFFTEPSFSGLQYTINSDSMAKVGPNHFATISYVHFGNDVWTVYPERDFRGKPKYLIPSGEIEDNFYYTEVTVLIVGSIKKGLHSSASNFGGASFVALYASIIILF